MTWNAFAALTSGKRPVWLFQITIGAATSYLTTHRDGYTYDSQSYTKTNLTFSNIRTTQEAGRAEVSLIFPRTNALAQSLRDAISTNATRVKILQGDENDGDQEFLTFFDGRVVETRPNLVAIDIVCESSFTRFRRKAIPGVMQRPCRHALYHAKDGIGCPVDKEDHYTSGTATAASGRVVTVTEASGQADGFYAGGLLRFGSVEATIWRHSGTTLTLLNEVEGLAAEITASGTASVEIARGCNRSFATCQVFGAQDDFGGFPWMTDSPFDGRQLL